MKALLSAAVLSFAAPAGAQAPEIGRAVPVIETGLQQAAPEATVWPKEAAEKVFEGGSKPSAQALLGGWKAVSYVSPYNEKGTYDPAGVPDVPFFRPLSFHIVDNPFAKPSKVLVAKSNWERLRCLPGQDGRSFTCRGEYAKTIDCRLAGPDHLICRLTSSYDSTVAYEGFVRDPGSAASEPVGAPWNEAEATTRFAVGAPPSEDMLLGTWRHVARLSSLDREGAYSPEGFDAVFAYQLRDGDSRLAFSKRVRHPLDGGLNTMKIEVLNFNAGQQPMSYAFEAGALSFTQEPEPLEASRYYNYETDAYASRERLNLDYRCRLADADHLLCQVIRTPTGQTEAQITYHGFARVK